MRRELVLVALVAVAALLRGAPPKGAPQASERPVAPDFTLKDQDGKMVRLSTFFREKPVVLVFVRESSGESGTAVLSVFRDDHEALSAKGISVLAISREPAASSKRIRERLKLPFPLLSDKDGDILKRYDALIEPSGEPRKSPCRVLLVDRTGSVAFAGEYSGTQREREALGKVVEALGEKGTVAMKVPLEKESPSKAVPLKIGGVEFGRIVIDGRTYTDDVVIEKGRVRERRKGPSKDEKGKYGHTPLTPREEIPWDSKVLIIGTGVYGKLPIVDELTEEAKRRGVELIILKTPDAAKYFLEHQGENVAAILHVTC